MASDGRAAGAAVSAAIVSPADQHHAAPGPRRWKGNWTRYWCFRFQRREKRIVPVARPHGAGDSSRGWLPVQAVLALVPPSSPASFVNSSVHSPVASSANSCSLAPSSTMFMIGPYAHETQLVSPPGFSTVTTEPSTAAVTPPPELAHLTTPSSPDVPFAQYIASSLEAKAARRMTISPLSTSAIPSPCDTPASHTPPLGHLSLRQRIRGIISPRSSSTLASPCETPGSYSTSGPLYAGIAIPGTTLPCLSSTLASPCDTPATYTPKSNYHYLGSPVSCLISPAVEVYAEGCTTPNHSSSFRSFDPYASPDLSPTFAKFILACDSISSMEEPVTPMVSAITSSDDPSKLNISTWSHTHPCRSSVNVKEGAGLWAGSEEEIHGSSLQQETGMGGLLAKVDSRLITCVPCQTDTEMSVFHM